MRTCSQYKWPFIEFSVDLQNKLQKSKLKYLQKSVNRDRIFCGIDSTSIRERLLRDNNLTWNRLAAIVRTKETSGSQVHNLDCNNIDMILRDRPNIY